MREIKFRATDIRGDWKYGSYIKNELGTWIIPPIATTPSGITQVDPGTVGQYTGLKDKNGTDIYEGDIVLADNKFQLKEPIFFEDGCFLWGGKGCLSDLIDSFDTYGLPDGNIAKIIGNIHENPEPEEGE